MVGKLEIEAVVNTVSADEDGVEDVVDEVDSEVLLVVGSAEEVVVSTDEDVVVGLTDDAVEDIASDVVEDVVVWLEYDDTELLEWVAEDVAWEDELVDLVVEEVAELVWTPTITGTLDDGAFEVVEDV